MRAPASSVVLPVSYTHLVEKELVSAIGSVNVFDLNSENFEIIKKIRGLKDTIEEIKGQCK